MQVKERWENSEAKRILERDLHNGTIPLTSEEMAPRVVYNLPDRPEFRKWPQDRFQNNLQNLREAIRCKKETTKWEEEALAEDQKLHPKPTHNYQGEPRWVGSDAEHLLQEDMDNGKHETMKPQKLWYTQLEFQHFQEETFQKHIDQEEQNCKFLAYLAHKQQKKAKEAQKKAKKEWKKAQKKAQKEAQWEQEEE